TLQKGALGIQSSFPSIAEFLQAGDSRQNLEYRSSLLSVAKSLIPWVHRITTKQRFARTTDDRSCSASSPEIFLVPKRSLTRPDYKLAPLPDRVRPFLKLSMLPLTVCVRCRGVHFPTILPPGHNRMLRYCHAPG